jgi:ureidoglycolate hydrolase
VAPPDDELRPERLRAFRVDPGQAVLLARGVWHGAPLALEAGSALVFLLAGTGREDTEVVRFEDAPVEITI